MKQVKKTVTAILVAATLAGCAALDGQDASKQDKTAEAAGAGAVVGGLLSRAFGGNGLVGAVVGALVAGSSEYIHATNVELAQAQKTAEALRQENIRSQIVTASYKEQPSLKMFLVSSAGPEAIKAIAAAANASPFNGQILAVVQKSDDEPAMREKIHLLLDDKRQPAVRVTCVTVKTAKQMGVTEPGIAWRPIHEDGPIPQQGATHV